MALPGHPAAAIKHRDRAQQHPAVDEHHHSRDGDLPEMAGEPAEHQQEGQPAEDQSGGADVIGSQRAASDAADQPGAQPAENPDDRGRPHEPGHAGERHQEAEHQGGHRVGQQVGPVRVQQWGEEDALESVGLQRPDSVAVESVPGQLIGDLDDVEQCDEGQDRRAAHLPPRPLGGRPPGRRLGHSPRLTGATFTETAHRSRFRADTRSVRSLDALLKSPGHQVAVGGDRGHRLSGQHTGKNGSGQTIGRRHPDRGGERRFRAHRRRSVR